MLQYTDGATREQYIVKLREMLRAALARLLKSLQIHEYQPSEVEIPLLLNGQQTGTAWLLRLASPGGPPAFLFLSEYMRESDGAHVAGAEMHCLHLLPESEAPAVRYLLAENAKQVIGVRFAVSGARMVGPSYWFDRTQFYHPELICNLLDVTVNLGLKLPPLMSAAGLRVGPLDDGNYKVSLTGIGNMPERLRKYVLLAN